MELVSDPTLVFLDEPTSGLDSTTSFELLDALKNYSRKGVNVVAVLVPPPPSFSPFPMSAPALACCA
jgi:ABC-type cobalamin/Fe3+-siderophores transport system ATPase subunit